MKKVAILLSLIVSVGATTLKVPSQYSTIQAAIDAASNGDTVLVAAGTYVENISISGVVTLLSSSGAGSTIIDGNYQSGGTISISGSATIDGFTIKGGLTDVIHGDDYQGVPDQLIGGGVYIQNSSDTCRIYNSLFIDNDCGINTINSNYIEIRSCTFDDNTPWIISFSNTNVINSIFSGEGGSFEADGLFFYDSYQIDISYSLIKDSGNDSNGNIDDNPLFCSDGYTLAANSPCIGTGENGANMGAFGVGCSNRNDGPVWHISTTGSDSTGDGSEDLPFGSINKGIYYSYSGDTVVVDSGTYFEVIDFDGKNIVITSISGADNTIIDGGNITFDIGEAYNGSVVTFRNKEDSTAVLNGFTIQNGYCDTYCNSGGYGGGIYIWNGTSPTLTNLIIKDNTSNIGGGIAIFNSSSSLILKNLVISQNNSIFYNGGGGGLYVNGSEVQLINVTIVDNIATNEGWLPPNDHRYGGGITTRSSASLSLNNCIIRNNYPHDIYLGGDGSSDTLFVEYSNLQGTSADIQSSGGNGIIYWGEGNIDADPLFCDYASNVYPNLKGDYHLMPSSPCVGTGENGVNMGAFGVGCEIDRLETLSEFVPDNYFLHENYPNPFNPTTTLRFDLPEVSDITLTIYNMLGQKVRTFDYQNTSAGYHSVTWDATNDYGDPVGAGVYLYQLRANEFVKTKKMVLLK